MSTGVFLSSAHQPSAMNENPNQTTRLRFMSLPAVSAGSSSFVAAVAAVVFQDPVPPPVAVFSIDLSTRGTVFYVAPETVGTGHPPEKADVYSFSVLILVIVAGRRPIHMHGSAMKFDRENLRTPELRPDSGDILKMLKGEMVIPVPPLETSTSPAAKVLTRLTGRN
ncbi:putative receptor-like protein kinase [Platanthera guangdongensis]|uniref:Receptor-like protein kinase n=1 Tax=Platanthera guangdongensis TaxID=2320717 RepID=A0ABR2LIQ9_9ASPA